MMRIELPLNVGYILNALNDAGYEAYAVGGCVRDSLLGKTPDDWDICTSAVPDEVERVFSKNRIVKTGIKHGTLTLIIEHIPYEITTFRTEAGYSDSRRPDSVSFVSDIAEDLKRRDFTVNAMAYNPGSGLVDLYGGKEDLKNKLIRCVGEPEERFLEDALRIMRAIRFSAVLGFEIEERTKNAVFKLSEKLKNIAAERINTEFTKTLMSDNCVILYEYKNALTPVTENMHKLDKKVCIAMNKLSKDKSTRLAMLMSALFSDSEEVKKCLVKMKYDTKTVNAVADILKCKNCSVPLDLKEARKLVALYGYDAVWGIFEIKNAMEQKGEYKNALAMLSEIKENKLCTDISGLEIGGEELIKIGFQKGPEIGRVLNKLLDMVIDGELNNEKNELSEAAKRIHGEKKMIKLGITGGSGCGKTTVSDIFRSEGIEVIDADKVARIVVEPEKPALLEIKEYFGEKYIKEDGTLDRKALGSYVFSNPGELLVLNQITHKYISAYIAEYIDNYSGDIIGIDGAALIESGISEGCDFLLSVLCDEETRISRIIARDNISYEAAKKRVAAQKKDDFYIEKSDYIVYNNSNSNELLEKVKKIIEDLRRQN